MSEEKFLTLHPSGKQGTNILKRRYTLVADAMMAAIKARGTATLWELVEALEDQIGDQLDGSMPWYVTTVKLDLEARGAIERVPKTSPHQVRITKK